MPDVNRRAFLYGAVIAAAVTACKPTATEFASDRISVAVSGNGPDIVLVHGLAASRDVWAAVADSLDESYRIHLVQINGFGGSPAGANAAGQVIAPVAEEVARYVRGLSQPAVIGHSMGGSIALMLASRHPDLVGRVMAVDAPPFLGAAFLPPGSSPDAITAVANQTRDAILATPAGGTGMLEQMVGMMARDEESKAMLLQQAKASHRPTVANAMHDAILLDLRPELPAIKAPLTALYVTPATLPVTPAQFDTMMRQEFATAAGVRLVRIDSSNHYIQLDQPGRFVAEVRAFMRR